MVRWWRKRKLGEKTAILGVVVATAGSVVIPIYFGVREERRASYTTPVTPTTVTTVSSASPISYVVEDNPAKISSFNDFGQELMIPKETQIVGGPGRSCTNFHPWGTKLGGVPAERTYLRLVVQGRTPSAMLIAGMRAKVVERRRPLVGTQLTCPSAGDAEIRSMDIDLDGASTEAEYRTSKGIEPFGFTLAKDETEVFDIRAVTKKCYCKWFLELDLVVDGKKSVQTISDNGRPFETTMRSDSLRYEWNYTDTWYLTGDPRSDDFIYEPQPRGEPLEPLS